MSQVLTADVCPNAPRSTPPTSETALFEAAKALLPVLAAGRPLDANVLRDAMTRAFGASDAEGAWVWKDAYEAAEAAVVLFLKRYGRAMRRRAGAGPEGPAAMLAMLQKLSSLEPSHTKRSEDQIRLQQFSTPLGLAYAALRAAAIRSGDVVMEPSAGTGMLAVMAECALGGEGALHLNEIANTRAGLLARLFPDASVTRHNAEAIADHLPGVRADVVLMNPPFSATPGVSRNRHDADLRHIRSAFFALAPGGRLVAITSAGCVPGDAAWNTVFSPIEAPARVVFTMAIEGRAYARRGTSFDTRLTVIDRGEERGNAVIDPAARADSPEELLRAVIAGVPARLTTSAACATVPAAPLRDLFGETPAPSSKERKTKTGDAKRPAEEEDHRRDLGPVFELAYEASPPCGDAPTAGPYAPWKPSVVSVSGAVAHPTPLVQSAAMAAVEHPKPSHRPLLPERVVTEGLLSDAQIESVVLAGEAHDRHLSARYRIGAGWETVRRCTEENGEMGVDAATTEDGEALSAQVRFRRGWMLGDGTGCGKGREVAAVMLDNRLRGRGRALWLSASANLLEDARRDWAALGGREEDVIPLGDFRQGADIPHESGILFATYATLRAPAREGKASRLDQVVAWLAGSLEEEDRHGFGGVIVFDESHAMANAAGSKGTRGNMKPSAQGRAGLRLQHALAGRPRVLYVSATGATTVTGLAYAVRLGLWGAGETPFERRGDFVSAMEAGGVAAMEVVARDLKALGLYQARALIV